MTCYDCKKAVKDSAAAGRIMADAMQKVENTNKRLWIVVLSLIAVILAMAGSMVYVAVNGQRMIDEATWKALNGAGEVTATKTEQTVDGDSATINNVKGDQFNDNAQKAEGEG